jgi:hypothetical protein
VKIAHVCLSGAFTEGLGYQDNALVDVNREDGHDVLIVSDCRKFEGAKIVATTPGKQVLKNGATLINAPFLNIFGSFLSSKLKICPSLYQILDEFKPDVILYHGIIGWSMLTVGKYKKNNPHTKLYLDSHEDKNNSALNFASQIFQYKIYNNFLLKKILNLIDKIFYISVETRDFLKEYYNIAEEIMEFYPLGGRIIDLRERSEKRKMNRSALDLSETQLVFLHTGKLDANKKTADVLDSFASIPDGDVVLLIAGSIPDDCRQELLGKIEADTRVKFLGWKTADELTEIMCAADVYVQPGTQSASLQVAICTGLPVLIYPYSSHRPFLDSNGFFVSSLTELEDRMGFISNNRHTLPQMKEASLKIANDLLDYKKIAARLYR